MLTNFVLLDVLLVILSLVATLYFWVKRKQTYWEKKGVRTLPSHWFFGNFKDAALMRTSLGMLFGQLHQQVASENDILGIYVLHKPFLLLTSPELIKQIFIRDFATFPFRHFTRRNVKDKLSTMNLFMMRNHDHWKYLRTKMTPVFTSDKLKNLFLLMVETTNTMRDYLRDQFNDESKIVSFKIKDLFYKYTTDVISSVAFGIRTNSFTNPTPEFYKLSREPFQQGIAKGLQYFVMFFFPWMVPYISNDLLGKNTNYFRKVFWSSMDNRVITKTKRGDLIDSLLQINNDTKTDDTFLFEGDVLVAQAAIFFAPGREKSINTMSYALYELASHPEMQKRVREEIREKIQAANGITYDAVQDMKYLHQVISETLRLHPPIPILDRNCIEDYKIPGTDIIIEKGTPVYVALHGLHMDPKYFTNPKIFDPERFSDERKNEIVPCSFIPFGEGPRNCIGLQLGYLQSAVGLLTILRDYEVALNPVWKDRTIDLTTLLTTPPAGFLLDLKKI